MDKPIRPSFTGAEVKAICEKVREACPALREMPDPHLVKLVGASIQDACGVLNGIEDRIAQAGCIPGDVAGALMSMGAAVGVFDDLPEGERKGLVAAGREIGKMLAEKWGAAVRARLVEKAGIH